MLLPDFITQAGFKTNCRKVTMGTAVSPDGKTLYIPPTGKRRCNHDTATIRPTTIPAEVALSTRASILMPETLHGQWRVGRCVGCRSKIARNLRIGGISPWGIAVVSTPK
jgi:hypothetical protein